MRTILLLFLALGLSFATTASLTDTEDDCILCAQTSGMKVCSDDTTSLFPIATICCDESDTTTAGCDGVCVSYSDSSLMAMAMCESTTTYVGSSSITLTDSKDSHDFIAENMGSGDFAIIRIEGINAASRRMLASSSTKHAIFDISKGSESEFDTDVIWYALNSNSFTSEGSVHQDMKNNLDLTYSEGGNEVFILVVEAN